MKLENDPLPQLLNNIDAALRSLVEAQVADKYALVESILDAARLIIVEDGGVAALESRSQTLDAAGVYDGTDWAKPQALIPALTPYALSSAVAATVTIECLSELRMLAIALGDYKHAEFSAEQAHHFLTQSIALNLELLFAASSEAARIKQGALAMVPRALMQHLAQRIGFQHIIDQLIDEIWRLLRQRPIQINPVKNMIT